MSQPTRIVGHKHDTQTNVTEEDTVIYQAMLDGEIDTALMSCFVDGEPTVAIVRVEHNPPTDDKRGSYELTPLFVRPTKKMILVDHQGVTASTKPETH